MLMKTSGDVTRGSPKWWQVPLWQLPNVHLCFLPWAPRSHVPPSASFAFH